MIYHDDHHTVPLAWTSERTIKRMRRMGLIPTRMNEHIDRIATNFVNQGPNNYENAADELDGSSVARQLFDTPKGKDREPTRGDATMATSLVEGNRSNDDMNESRDKAGISKEGDKRMEMHTQEGKQTDTISTLADDVLDLTTPTVVRRGLEKTIAIPLIDQTNNKNDSKNSDTEVEGNEAKCSKSDKVLAKEAISNTNGIRNKKEAFLKAVMVCGEKEQEKVHGEGEFDQGETSHPDDVDENVISLSLYQSTRDKTEKGTAETNLNAAPHGGKTSFCLLTSFCKPISNENDELFLSLAEANAKVSTNEATKGEKCKKAGIDTKSGAVAGWEGVTSNVTISNLGSDTECTPHSHDCRNCCNTALQVPEK